MALKSIINTKVPEETVGEKKLSEREVYLLKALLNLLLYTGLMKTEGKGEGLFFVSGVTKPTNLAGGTTPTG